MATSTEDAVGDRRPKTRRGRMRLWPIVVWGAVAFFFVNLIGLVASVVVDSLGTRWFGTWLPEGFTLHWYADAWREFGLSSVLLVTLEVAVAEAVNALVVIGGAPPDHSRPVRRALEYVRERLGDSITLDDLADHADLDKFHLCRAFRAQMGMPPHTYLTHLRIARAKELLLGGVRASDLAPLVGLYDQAQLTRHFRRLVGTTPARYGKSPQDPRYRGVLAR